MGSVKVSASGQRTDTKTGKVITPAKTTSSTKTGVTRSTPQASQTSAQRVAEIEAAIKKGGLSSAQLQNYANELQTIKSGLNAPGPSNDLRNLSVGLAQGQNITQEQINQGALKPGGAQDYVGQQGLADNGASPELRNLSIGMAQQQGAQPSVEQEQQGGQAEQINASYQQQLQQNQATMQGGQGGQPTQGGQVQGQAGAVVDPGMQTPYVSFNGAYFQQTPQGLMAVADPNILNSLRSGTIPSQASSSTKGFIFGPGIMGAEGVMGAPPTPNTTGSMDYYSQFSGTTADQLGFQSDPVSTIATFARDIMDALGIGEVTSIIQKEAKEIEKLENKRDAELRDVDDNPWLTEGLRLRQRQNVEEKYQDELGNKEAKLQRLQRDKELAVAQSQWAVGTAISLWDAERKFQQQQAMTIYSMQQDKLEWEYKQKVFDQGVEQYEMDYAFKAWNAQEGFKAQQQALDLSWYNAKTSRINATSSGTPNGLDAVTARQLTERVSANDELIRLAEKYQATLRDKGFTFAGPLGDKQTQGVMNSLRGQMVAAYKKAESLGTLDAGVITLMDTILGESPVSYNPFANFTGGAQAKLDSSMTTLLESLYIQRNSDGSRLGLSPIAPLNSQAGGVYESPTGNTYNLPFTTSQSTSQTR